MMLLLGGTGLLGGRLLKRLCDDHVPLKLFTRGARDWRDSSVQNVREKGVEFIIADALDVDRLSAAAEGCSAIINLIGSMPPHPGMNYRDLHVGVVNNILQVAKEQRIQRVIHVSCLAAHSDSPGEYLKTKLEAESIVKSADLYWTIFRPSYIFGDRFPFLEAVAPLIKLKVCMPVVGSGQNELQPVHVDSVAHCIATSIYEKKTVGKVFELAGDETFTILELMEKARKGLGIPGVSMNIPSPSAAKVVDKLAQWFPKRAISAELINLLLSNSITENNALNDFFQLDPVSLDDHFSKIVAAIKAV